MFIYSVKTSKAKIATLIVAAAAIVAAVVFIIGGKGKPAATNDSAINYLAGTGAERTAFLSQFGWRISEDPSEVSEVIIPENFDDGYVKYAEMNRAQGLDLEPYKGLRAKRWTYDVLNYPGRESKAGSVQANLLVYKGRVIGGDVCSLELGGFIQGFEFPSSPAPSTSGSPTKKTADRIRLRSGPLSVF